MATKAARHHRHRLRRRYRPCMPLCRCKNYIKTLVVKVMARWQVIAYGTRPPLGPLHWPTLAVTTDLPDDRATAMHPPPCPPCRGPTEFITGMTPFVIGGRRRHRRTCGRSRDGPPPAPVAHRTAIAPPA